MRNIHSQELANMQCTLNLLQKQQYSKEFETLRTFNHK